MGQGWETEDSVILYSDVLQTAGRDQFLIALSVHKPMQLKIINLMPACHISQNTEQT